MRKLMMGLAVSSMILTACNKAPEVSMTVPAAGNVGENVAMTNGSDLKKTYNVSWSFGDGGTATTWDANHTYGEPGDYTVTLTATSKKGNNSATETSVITISDNGIGAVETKWEENQVAMDAWWTKAVGTWTFGTGSVTFTGCGTSAANSDKDVATAASKAIKVTILTPSIAHDGGSYYMNENGKKSDYTFEYIDDTHVKVGFLRVKTDSKVNDHTTMTSGIYVYSNTGSLITLTRTEDTFNSFNGSDDPCTESQVYTYTLTK